MSRGVEGLVPIFEEQVQSMVLTIISINRAYQFICSVETAFLSGKHETQSSITHQR